MDDKVDEFLKAKPDRFSAQGELYQAVKDGSVPATRDLNKRWKAYGIPRTVLQGASILDVGCCVGGFSAFCKDYCKSYLGIDVTADSIELARHLYPFPNCSFEVLSFNDLQNERFDVILALAVRRYTGLTFSDFALATHTLLNSGGRMYFESHTRERWIPKTRKAFEQYFNVLRIKTVPAQDARHSNYNRFFVELMKK